jgi:hypothetical protein
MYIYLYTVYTTGNDLTGNVRNYYADVYIENKYMNINIYKYIFI